MTVPYCLFCLTSLPHHGAVIVHNASSCPYKRELEEPHRIQKVLATRRLPRPTVADRENVLREYHEYAVRP